MEEGRGTSSTKPCNLLKKIKVCTRSLIQDLCSGQSPSVELGRYRNYCTDPTGNCCCSSDKSKGKEILSLQRDCYAHRLNVMLRVLLIVQKLLQENKHGSKRDIYYMHPSIFSEQAVVDRAINDICILLNCSRHNLNVVSVGKGLVMGWLRFFEGGRKFDCMRNPSNAYPVPVYVEDVKDIISVAQYILIVEKEAAFQRLSDDKFCDKNRCIIVTGRGYPDVPTRRVREQIDLLQNNLHIEEIILIRDHIQAHLRVGTIDQNILIFSSPFIVFYVSDLHGDESRTDSWWRKHHGEHQCRGHQLGSNQKFLRLLMEKLHLPTYCLVDCDPYGFDILTTYRFGSMQMAYDVKFLRLPEIRWLGAFPSDSAKYQLPERCLLPLTAEDKRKAEAMLQRCYLHQEAPQWRSELELMVEKGVKFEIEALSVTSISFLSEKYIPHKIQFGVYI